MTDAHEDLAKRFEIGVAPNEHGGYYARVPDFPTLFTGGQTAEEAFRNALEAVELMIEEVGERSQPERLRSSLRTRTASLPHNRPAH